VITLQIHSFVECLYIMDVTASKCQVSSKGPTYKVNIIVDSVPIRGLLDHGAQVTLVRKELLSMIRKKLGSKEQCHSHNLPIDVQPIGQCFVLLYNSHYD